MDLFGIVERGFITAGSSGGRLPPVAKKFLKTKQREGLWGWLNSGTSLLKLVVVTEIVFIEAGSPGGG